MGGGREECEATCGAACMAAGGCETGRVPLEAGGWGYTGASSCTRPGVVTSQHRGLLLMASWVCNEPARKLHGSTEAHGYVEL